MFTGPVITNKYQQASDAFQAFRSEAKWGNFIQKVFGREFRLTSFSDRLLGHHRTFRGVQDIHVSQITGSVERVNDFDRNFRPLRDHLVHRWVSLYLNSQTGAWEPIRVFKVGNTYFVQDGHHRVSVARYVGMVYITAEVWEFAANNARPSVSVKINPPVTIAGARHSSNVRIPAGLSVDCRAVEYNSNGTMVQPSGRTQS